MQAQAEILQLGESALSQLQQEYKDLNSAQILKNCKVY